MHTTYAQMEFFYIVDADHDALKECAAGQTGGGVPSHSMARGRGAPPIVGSKSLALARCCPLFGLRRAHGLEDVALLPLRIHGGPRKKLQTCRIRELHRP